ncbi:MAG: hypothetical protein Q8733_00300 [Pigeon pea little leaf phytoplasma]|nr:hypothetical protein [Pigeon pea little leaf phytoplasma]
MDKKRKYQSTSGSPQGGIISLLLANIYLDYLDKKLGELVKAGKTQFKMNPKYIRATKLGIYKKRDKSQPNHRVEYITNEEVTSIKWNKKIRSVYKIMNFLKYIVLTAKLSAAMLGFNTVDFFRDEVNAKLAPLKREIKLSYEKRKLNENLEIVNLSPQEIYTILNKKNIDNLSPHKIHKILNKKNIDNLSLQKKDEMLNINTDLIMVKNIDNINWETINNIVNDADFETIKQWNLIFSRYNFYNDNKKLLNKMFKIINLSPQQIYKILNEKNINNLSPQKIDEMLNINTDRIMVKNIDNINWETINDIVNDADFETIKQWNLIFSRYNFYKNYSEKNNIFNN